MYLKLALHSVYCIRANVLHCAPCYIPSPVQRGGGAECARPAAVGDRSDHGALVNDCSSIDALTRASTLPC